LIANILGKYGGYLNKRLLVTLTTNNKSYQLIFYSKNILRSCLLLSVLAVAISIFIANTRSQNILLQEQNIALNSENQLKNQSIEMLNQHKNDAINQTSLIKFKLDENQLQLNYLTKLLSFVPSELQDTDATYLELIDEVSFRKLALVLLPSGRPITNNKISSDFGSRRHPINRVKQFHKGIDLITPIGSPVYATADGVINSLQNNPKGYGKLIKITHGLGFTTYYGHLNKILVTRNQVVIKNQLIGYSGNTGLSTGPHLHYEVRFGQVAINPKPFMQLTINNFDQIPQQIKELPWDSLKTNMIRLLTTQQPLLLLNTVKSQETLQ
jgi:murein DD-endopeptidase MepM/ murein hydrolase activator NlpD